MNNISWPIKANNNEWINILKPNEIASRQKQGPREAIQVFSFGREDKRKAERRGLRERSSILQLTALAYFLIRRKESNLLCSQNSKHPSLLHQPIILLQ